MADSRGQPAYGDEGVPEVPGYRIERLLGRGSMGVVYLAEDEKMHRKVALKILAPALADDELFRKRFNRESASAANLDHPNIVPVYAAGEAGGLLYIAMRYVRGGDLRSLLQSSGPLSLEQASSIVTSVADALDAARFCQVPVAFRRSLRLGGKRGRLSTESPTFTRPRSPRVCVNRRFFS